MRSSRQYCTFSVGDLTFGVDVLKVQEVIQRQEVTRVPLASRVVRGLSNLRGQIVMAIDLRRRMELDEDDFKGDSIHVIVKTEDRPVSFVVDEVGDILDLDAEAMEPTLETLPPRIRELVMGIYKLEGRLLLVLDSDLLVSFDAAIEPAA